MNKDDDIFKNFIILYTQKEDNIQQNNSAIKIMFMEKINNMRGILVMLNEKW